jgi:hypothetical protein
MGRVKRQVMLVLIGGWRYSLTQSFGFTHFALGVGDLKREKYKSFPK